MDFLQIKKWVKRRHAKRIERDFLKYVAANISYQLIRDMMAREFTEEEFEQLRKNIKKFEECYKKQHEFYHEAFQNIAEKKIGEEIRDYHEKNKESTPLYHQKDTPMD